VAGTAGTAFTLLQSAVEYIDYFRKTATSDGESVDAARMYSAQHGSGHSLKREAVAVIAELTAA
jgi:hypothetical protein